MLIDIVLAGAPLVALAPAVATAVTGHAVFGSRAVLQRRLYRSLLLAEKLSPTIAGGPQISAGTDRDAFALAYVTQFPQRATDIAHIALMGVGLLAAMAAYYVAPGGLLTDLAMLAVVIAVAVWLHRMVANFVRVETVTRELFIHLDAPDALVRPELDLVARTPKRTAAMVLADAADIRDASTAALSTLDAVNLALVAGQVPWRTHLRAATNRARVTKIPAGQVFSLVGLAWRWLLDQAAEPVFKLRLAILDLRERDRVNRANRTGDVYRATWLAEYYRNERDRIDRYRSWLHTVPARNVRSRWPLHSERDRTSVVR